MRNIDVENLFVLHCDRALRGVTRNVNGGQGLYRDLADRVVAVKAGAQDTRFRRVTQAALPGALLGGTAGFTAIGGSGAGLVQNPVRATFERILAPSGGYGIMPYNGNFAQNVAADAPTAVAFDLAIYADTRGAGAWNGGPLSTPRVSGLTAAQVFRNPTRDPATWDFSIQSGTPYKAVAFAPGSLPTAAGDDGCDWASIAALIAAVRPSAALVSYSWLT